MTRGGTTAGHEPRRQPAPRSWQMPMRTGGVERAWLALLAAALLTGALRLRPDILGRLTSEGRDLEKTQPDERRNRTDPPPHAVHQLLGSLHRRASRLLVSGLGHSDQPSVGWVVPVPSAAAAGRSDVPAVIPSVAKLTLAFRAAAEIAPLAMSTPVTP